MHGLKAGGLLAALEKFETFFSRLKLGCLLFGCSENTSKVLQAKDITMQVAVAAITVTQTFYKRQREDEAFNTFFDRVEQDARSLNIGLPVLPNIVSLQRDLMGILNMSLGSLVIIFDRSILKPATY